MFWRFSQIFPIRELPNFVGNGRVLPLLSYNSEQEITFRHSLNIEIWNLLISASEKWNVIALSIIRNYLILRILRPIFQWNFLFSFLQHYSRGISTETFKTCGQLRLGSPICNWSYNLSWGFLIADFSINVSLDQYQKIRLNWYNHITCNLLIQKYRIIRYE